MIAHRALVAIAVVAGAALTPIGPTAAEAARTCSVTGGDAVALKRAIASLGPSRCVMLSIGPGRYDVDPAAIAVTPGTVSHPVTLRAADPAHRPLITGGLTLKDASFWVIDGLRFEGTLNTPGDPVHGIPPLFMHGGTGWRVRHSEFFGSPTFQAATLFAIFTATTKGRTTYAQGFTIAHNCFHDASREVGLVDRNKDHLLYARQIIPAGVPDLTTSRIRRNVFFHSTNGGAIKLGTDDVEVVYNTFQDVDNAVIVQSNPEPAATALHGIVANKNLIASLRDVYGRDSTMPQPMRAFDGADLDRRPYGTLTDDDYQAVLVNNRVWNRGHPYEYAHFGPGSSSHEFRYDDPPAPQRDPAWQGGRVGNCTSAAYRPTDATLEQFGRYGRPPAG